MCGVLGGRGLSVGVCPRTLLTSVEGLGRYLAGQAQCVVLGAGGGLCSCGAFISAICQVWLWVGGC